MKKNTLYAIILVAGMALIALANLIIFSEPQTQNTLPNQTIAISNNPSKTFTAEEVAKHNIKTDCYLIVSNQVYDVSSYISKHPGGVRRIVDVCGQETSQIFASIHSNFAWNLLKEYYIGDIVK